MADPRARLVSSNYDASTQVSPSEMADNATQSVSLPRNALQVLLDYSRLTVVLQCPTTPRTAILCWYKGHQLAKIIFKKRARASPWGRKLPVKQ